MPYTSKDAIDMRLSSQNEDNLKRNKDIGLLIIVGISSESFRNRYALPLTSISYQYCFTIIIGSASREWVSVLHRSHAQGAM